MSSQCDQESQDNKETKEATFNIFSDKEKEVNHLKNQNQILLKEVKQLKCKVKSILKVDKETSMEAI